MDVISKVLYVFWQTDEAIDITNSEIIGNGLNSRIKTLGGLNHSLKGELNAKSAIIKKYFRVFFQIHLRNQNWIRAENDADTLLSQEVNQID
jgi:hypothetical protein